MSLESHEKARVIRPLPVTQANLIASNVPEDDHPQWISGATYAVDEWVIDEHFAYQAVAENEGLRPKDNPTIWNPEGPTNKFKMFDRKVGTQTVRKDGIDVTAELESFVDSIAILNVVANVVRFTGTDPYEGVVFEHEEQMFDEGCRNWWQYFFKPIRRRRDAVVSNLPPYAGLQIRAEVIVAPGQEARVGALIFGSQLVIGCARWGSSVGFRDYSQKVEDKYGNLDVREGAWAKRPELDLIIETDRVDHVLEELIALRAIPCVYIGHSRFTMTIAYGYFRELMPVLSNPSISECTLTIEALT